MPGKRQKRGGFKTLRLPKALRFLQPAQAAVKQTFCRKLPDAQEGRPRLAARRGPAGFVPAGSEATGAATGAPLAPAGRAPPPRAAAGTPGGGLARHGGLRGSRRPAARPGRSRPGSCPPPGRPFACGAKRERSCQGPDRRGGRDFSGWFRGSPGGKVPPLPRRPPAPGELRRVSGGARRSPPEAAVRGLQGEDRALPPSRGSL